MMTVPHPSRATSSWCAGVTGPEASSPPRGILHPDFPAFLAAHAQERERLARRAETFIPETPVTPSPHDMPPFADLRDGGTLDRWMGGPWWRRQHRADKALLIAAGVACAVGAVAALAGVM